MVHPFRGHGHAGGDLNVNFSDQASSMRIEPIRAFDGEIMAPSIAVSLRHQLPTNVFLVECMLEKLCSVYTQTPEQKRELYEKLKNVFASLHLLPRYEGSPEMEGMRLRLGRDLNRVFLLAQRSIVTRRGQVQDGALVTSHTPLFRNLDDVVENLFNSRYESDFTEVNFIARGGFGVVFKACNKLDGNEYAIKKVIVRASSAEKIIQEVQLLSRLHHANVVAYKTAWLENSSAQTLGKIIELEEDSSSQTSSTPGARMKPSHDHLATLSSEESQDSFIVFEHGDSTSTKSVSSSLSLIRTDHSYSNQTTSSPLMLLFIQMQLCGHTLRSWLDKRNNDQDSTIHTRQLELNLFRQILQGLDYVHSKHIVHRDIKPENIFLNETCDQVRIGDFGLAKLDPSTSVFNCSDVVLRVTTSATLNKSKGVGTTSYAAPEQLDGTHYSAKSDMYSVGVVLLELLMPFRTVMERHKCISDLRELRQIPRLVDEKWPFMAGLILELTCGDPVSRPTARQVVDRLAQHSMDNDVVSNNNTHQRTIGQLQDTIDQLRRQLMEKDAKIEQLTRMVNGL